MIDYYGVDGWNDYAVRELDRQRVARSTIKSVWPAEGPVRFLDVGCADGIFLERVAAHMQRADAHFVGVDLSEHQLELAARLPFEFHRCDLAEGIPLADESFDIVHAAEVIEHLVDPDRLVDEAARVLKPGGHLIITTPNLHAWYNRILMLAGIQPIFYETSARSALVGAGPLARLRSDPRPVGHLRLMHRAALRDLLRLSGLRPVSFRGARFEGVPGPARWLDRAFCLRPSMSSILVVAARKDA